MVPVLIASQISKSFGVESGRIDVLREVSFEVQGGEFVALCGPSGCGKSTLLTIIGLADRPSSGELVIDGERVTECAETALQRVRRTKLGYVFQQFNLLSTLTACENVMLPLLLTGESVASAQKKAEELLARVGLAHRAAALPFSLSGGESQRVALARAVVHRPKLILADEPTGNLDSRAGEQVLSLLTALVSQGVSVLMATHSEEAVRSCSRVLRLMDGRLTS